MAERLTKRLVDKLAAEADPAKDKLVWDAEVPGLVLRLRSGGAGFAFQYKHRGRTRRITLGKFGALTIDQARDQARALYGEVRAGGDPADAKREARAKRTTFAEASRMYLADLRERADAGAKRGKRSTAAEFDRLLARCILPKLGSREVEAIGLQDVEKMHRALAATPRQANAALTVTSAVLGFAERRGLRPSGPNPCRLVERLRERGRKGRLTLKQLEALGEALRESEAAGENSSVVLAIRLLALTGLRRSELVGHALKVRRTAGSGLRWEHVDFDHRSLDLRDAKAGARMAPIGRAAVDLLKRAKPAGAKPEDHVCPGALPGSPIVGIDKPALRLLASAGIEGGGLHALRRTFASLAAEAGYSELLIAALLGHRRGGVTAGYVIADADPLRAAADRISGQIAAALNPRQDAEVIPFRKP